MEYLNLFIKSVFVDNMIFAFFLGMCSFLAVSKNVKTAAGLGLAVIFVLGITLPLNYLLYEYILKPGALTWLNPSYASVDLSFLSYIVFIATIATFTQIVEMAGRRIRVRDTDRGRQLQAQLQELSELLYAYQHGMLKEVKN